MPSPHNFDSDLDYYEACMSQFDHDIIAQRARAFEQVLEDLQAHGLAYILRDADIDAECCGATLTEAVADLVTAVQSGETNKAVRLAMAIEDAAIESVADIRIRMGVV